MKRGRAARAGWWTTVTLALFCIAAPARPGQTTLDNGRASSGLELDLPSYAHELARIAESSKNPAELQELRRSLPDVWIVKNGKQTFRVPTEQIAGALETLAHNPGKASVGPALRIRLELMREQAQALAQGPANANQGDAEKKLKKILERGEFQTANGPSAWDTLKARIYRWLFLHLIKLLSLLHISRKTGNAIAWIVLFAAVVLIFYVVYRWLTKSAAATEFRAETEATPSDARHWIHEAMAAADRGDFREAMHCGYWAAVAHLEDVRLLSRDRTRTPRESVRLLEQHPKEQGLLRGITQSFELIWYGYRPVSATEWDGTKETLEKMGCPPGSTAPTVPS